MRKSWNLTGKLLTGKKTIESRWYQNRYKPWDHISRGDVVYFKNSGEPVTIRAVVSKVLQFSDLTPGEVRDILRRYGSDDGLGLDEIDKYSEMFKDKRYCILIFLRDVQEIESFNIDKSGFGNMASWLIVDDIEKIRIW